MADFKDQLKQAGYTPSRQDPPGGRRQGGRDAPGGARPRTAATDCSGESYFDESGHLLLRYVSRREVEPIVIGFAQDRPSLNMHQLNRFFRYCRTIERRLQRRDTKWEDERLNVVKLSVFAADAYGKSQKKIPEAFWRFIDCNVDRVTSEQAFCKGFMEHFQAVMGFAALHLRER